MRTNACCPGDHNPWVPPPVCDTCADLKLVFPSPKFGGEATRRRDEIIPCPACSDPAKFRLLFDKWRRKWEPPPDISYADLTNDERALVETWRDKGHNLYDCLRWIEGRRFDPERDPKFMAEVEKELGTWRRLSGRIKDPTFAQAVIERPALPAAPDETDSFDFDDEEAP